MPQQGLQVYPSLHRGRDLEHACRPLERYNALLQHEYLPMSHTKPSGQHCH